MSKRTHRVRVPRPGFRLDVVWTGNTGQGTSSYHSYERTHEIRAVGKQVITGSADPEFLGEEHLYNPEELLVAALAQCHMLWYLHLAADTGVVILGYHDQVHATMAMNDDGSGEFEEVVLRPDVAVADRANLDVAEALHQRAHEWCFIARSVNFSVRLEPAIRVAN